MQEMQEMWAGSLGQEDPLEEEMATHSSILAWKIPWTEQPGRLQSMVHKGLDTTECEHTHTHVNSMFNCLNNCPTVLHNHHTILYHLLHSHQHLLLSTFLQQP